MKQITQGSLFYLDWFQRESFSLQAMGRELVRYIDSLGPSDDADMVWEELTSAIELCSLSTPLWCRANGHTF